MDPNADYVDDDERERAAGVLRGPLRRASRCPRSPSTRRRRSPSTTGRPPAARARPSTRSTRQASDLRRPGVQGPDGGDVRRSTPTWRRTSGSSPPTPSGRSAWPTRATTSPARRRRRTASTTWSTRSRFDEETGTAGPGRAGRAPRAGDHDRRRRPHVPGQLRTRPARAPRGAVRGRAGLHRRPPGRARRHGREGGAGERVSPSSTARPRPRPSARPTPRGEAMSTVTGGRRTIAVMAVVAVVCLAAGLGLSRLIVSPGEAAADAAPPTAGPITVPVESRVIANDVVDPRRRRVRRPGGPAGRDRRPRRSGRRHRAGADGRREIDAGARGARDRRAARHRAAGRAADVPRRCGPGSPGPTCSSSRRRSARWASTPATRPADRVRRGDRGRASRALYQRVGYEPPAAGDGAAGRGRPRRARACGRRRTPLAAAQRELAGGRRRARRRRC